MEGLLCSKVDYVLPYMFGASRDALRKTDAAMAMCARTAMGLLQATSAHVVLAEAGIMPAELRAKLRLEQHLARLQRVGHQLIPTLQNERAGTTPGLLLVKALEQTGGGRTGYGTSVKLDGLGRASFSCKWNENVPNEGRPGGPDEDILFTDAAQSKETGRWSAVAVNTLGTMIDGTILEGEGDSTRAELQAVLLAVQAGDSQRDLRVITDSLRSIQLLRQADCRLEHFEVITHILQALRRRQEKATVFQWCPVHAGVKGNELANSRARRLLSENQGVTPTSLALDYQSIRRNVKSKMKTEWKEMFKSAAPNSKRSQMGLGVNERGCPSTGANRSLATTAHRLRCGKGMTASTRHQMKIALSPNCASCEVYGDVIHLLDRCKRLEDARREWMLAVRRRTGREPDLRERMRNGNLAEMMEFAKYLCLEV